MRADVTPLTFSRQSSFDQPNGLLRTGGRYIDAYYVRTLFGETQTCRPAYAAARSGYDAGFSTQAITESHSILRI